jgi:hypothetical protein
MGIFRGRLNDDTSDTRFFKIVGRHFESDQFSGCEVRFFGGESLGGVADNFLAIGELDAEGAVAQDGEDFAGSGDRFSWHRGRVARDEGNVKS